MLKHVVLMQIRYRHTEYVHLTHLHPVDEVAHGGGGVVYLLEVALAVRYGLVLEVRSPIVVP